MPLQSLFSWKSESFASVAITWWSAWRLQTCLLHTTWSLRVCCCATIVTFGRLTCSGALRSSEFFQVWRIYNFFPLASLTNLAAISLKRMHATFRPFQHRLTKKKIFGAAVAGVWFTAACLSTAIVFSPRFLGRLDITTVYHVQVSFYSPLLHQCSVVRVFKAT